MRRTRKIAGQSVFYPGSPKEVLVRIYLHLFRIVDGSVGMLVRSPRNVPRITERLAATTVHSCLGGLVDRVETRLRPQLTAFAYQDSTFRTPRGIKIARPVERVATRLNSQSLTTFVVVAPL
jgi:hypothetical protein